MKLRLFLGLFFLLALSGSAFAEHAGYEGYEIDPNGVDVQYEPIGFTDDSMYSDVTLSFEHVNYIRNFDGVDASFDLPCCALHYQYKDYQFNRADVSSSNYYNFLSSDKVSDIHRELYDPYRTAD